MTKNIFFVPTESIGHLVYDDVNTESFVHRCLVSSGYLTMLKYLEIFKSPAELPILEKRLSEIAEYGLKSVDKDLLGRNLFTDVKKYITYRFLNPYLELTHPYDFDNSSRFGTYMVNGKTMSLKKIPDKTWKDQYLDLYNEPFESFISPIEAIGIKCVNDKGEYQYYEYHMSNMAHRVGFLKVGSVINNAKIWNRNKASVNWIETNETLRVLEIFSIQEYTRYKTNDIIYKIMPYNVDGVFIFGNDNDVEKNIKKVSSSDYFATSCKTLFEIRQYYKLLLKSSCDDNRYNIRFDSFEPIINLYKKKCCYSTTKIKTYNDFLNIINENDNKKHSKMGLDDILTDHKDNNKNKENKGFMKGIFSNLMEKYKSMLVPVTDPRLKITMDGNVAVRNNDGEYVAIKANNEIVSYPEDFTIDVPIYIIKKPFSAISVGETIRKDNTYVKVIKKNNDGSLKCLSFTGYTTTKKGVTDFMLGTSYAEVIVNIMNVQNSGINPMMLAFMNGGSNMKDLMMMSMMMGQNGGGMNPMMMAMLLGGDKDGDSSMSKMMELMMMSQMFGQNNGGFNSNPFANMFNGFQTPTNGFNPFEMFQNAGNSKSPGKFDEDAPEEFDEDAPGDEVPKNESV